MRHRPLILLAMASSVACAYVSGCEADSGVTPIVTSDAADGSAGGTLADVATRPLDAEAPSSAMRVAHMAPRLGAIDFCYRRAADPRFVGPVLTGPTADGGVTTDAEAGLDAAIDTGVDAKDTGIDAKDTGPADATADAATADTPLLPLTVTTYLGVQGAGTFELAIVAAGAGTCQNPLRTGQVTLDPGKLTTVVLMERNALDAGAPIEGGVADAAVDGAADAGPPTVLTVASLTDDAIARETSARIRFVHAALGTVKLAPLGDLSVTAAGGTNPVLAAVVEPGRATRAQVGLPIVDPLGYADVPPISPLTGLRVAETRPAGFTWTSVFTDLGLTPTSIHTGFVTMVDKDVVVVLCNDRATVGRRTSCVAVGRGP